MSRVISITIFFLFLIVKLEAQNLNSRQLDSLYNQFLNIRSTTGMNHNGIQSTAITHIKCGFGLVSSIKSNINHFTIAQQTVLKSLLDRSSSDTSIVTPGGFFRIHYNNSGSNAPVYSIDSLAIALDSVYNFEVSYLGYPPPPTSNSDSKYDIYISNLPGEYGETDTVNEVTPGSGHYFSYMLIGNDFSHLSDTINYHLDYYGSNGINAARVTVAHEFHHAIQVGNYIDRLDDDAFFYELTSTSMEHFVYPTIPDYIHYLNNYFNYTNESLGKKESPRYYALAIWNIFLKDNFGYNIIKRQWELMPKMRALQAIANSFTEYNTSFGEQFNKFGIWTYYTNYRSIPNKYFEDAAYYPPVLPIVGHQITGSITPVKLNSAPVSNNFITFVNSQNQDSLVALITNADVDNGINNTSAALPFTFNLYTYAQNGSSKLADNYYDNFSADKPAFWVTSAILNNMVIDTGIYITQNNDYVFPSPFNYKKNSYIYIPAKPDTYGIIEMNIYNTAMKLMYSVKQNVIDYNGHKVAKWNGLDKNNNRLSSGVYLYVTKSGDEIKKGKLVIFNE
jgi:hypothetical protein